MIPALPPAPPAHVMTLEEATRIASGKGAPETVTLGDMLDALSTLVQHSREPAPVFMQPWRAPFRIGRKTKGKRDASLRSRANRRKA